VNQPKIVNKIAASAACELVTLRPLTILGTPCKILQPFIHPDLLLCPRARVENQSIPRSMLLTSVTLALRRSTQPCSSTLAQDDTATDFQFKHLLFVGMFD
jgi:hypothetical protein